MFGAPKGFLAQQLDLLSAGAGAGAVRRAVCRTCEGCGVVGVESRTSFAVDSRTCEDCGGSGERDVEEGQ